MIKYPYDSPRGPHHTFARNVKYSGGLQNFTEVPIRPNPISLAHCKMLPAIPIQDIGSKGFFPNRSVVNLLLLLNNVGLNINRSHQFVNSLHPILKAKDDFSIWHTLSFIFDIK